MIVKNVFGIGERVRGVRLYTLLVLSLIIATTSYGANNAPQAFTYEGYLTQSGTAVSDTSVTFLLQIYNPAANCLLYEEKQSGIDLSSNPGYFSLQVGSSVGDSKRVSGVDPGLSMATIYANAGTQILASGSSNCSAGYTPASGDNRLLRVTVTLTGGSPTALSPDLTLGSFPHAIVAESLQGVNASGFIQVDSSSSLTQSNAKSLTNGSDASSLGLHTHDSAYMKLSSSSAQNVGSGGLYTLGGVAVGSSGAASGSKLSVVVTSASTKGEVIQANSSQSANLFEIDNSSGSSLFSVDSSGNIVMASQKTLALGTYSSTPSGLGASDVGKIWFDSTLGKLRYWDGSQAQTTGNQGLTNLSSAGSIPYVSSSGTLSQDNGNLFWDATNHRLGIGTNSPASSFNIPVAPTASANYGLASLGSGAWDGSTSGFFSGSSSGTVLACNAATGYAGNLMDLQVAGSSKFKVDASGNVTVGGTIAMNSTKITSLATPTASTDASTKGYVDSQISGVVTSFNTRTGAVTLSSSDVTTALNYTPVNKAGDTMTGTLNLASNGLAVGTSQLVVSGGNVGIGTTSPTGKFNIPVAPTASANYGLASLGSGAWDGSTSGFFSGSSSGTVLACNAATGYAGNLMDLQVAGSSKFKVDASGNVTVGGTIAMNSTKITSLATPTASTDASTKGYVDGLLGSGLATFTGPTAARTYTLPDATSTILTTNSAVTVAQGGTGATGATAGFNALSPITTKGDVITSNGTNNVRLGVGSDRAFLIADSTQTTGLNWATFGSVLSLVVTSAVASGTCGSGTNDFIGFFGLNNGFGTSEANQQIVMPMAGTLKNLYVFTLSAQNSSGSLVLTMRKNLATPSSSLTVTIAAGAGASTSGSDTTDTVSVSAGDRINLEVTCNITSGNNAAFIASVLLTPAL